jgi:hypothetical protein
MTAIKSWTIQCDGCGDSIGSGDLGDRTAAEGRYQAKADGAHVNLPGGRDICAGCWAEGYR